MPLGSKHGGRSHAGIRGGQSLNTAAQYIKESQQTERGRPYAQQTDPNKEGVLVRSTVFALLVALTFAPACGTLDDQEPGDIELSQLGGLELPADYAGGKFVRVKGTLTAGGTKSGTMTGRDLYHGYTVTARRGATIYLRGITDRYMGLVAIYGPQAADGSWGPQLNKKWSWRPAERKIPTVSQAVTKGGKYLAVLGIPQRDLETDGKYVLSACDGDCVAGACLERTTPETNNYGAINLLNRAEAQNILGPNDTVRTGSCGSQPRSCPRTRAPVCGNLPPVNHNAATTYANLCLAQVAQRDAMADSLAPLNLYAQPGACAQ